MDEANGMREPQDLSGSIQLLQQTPIFVGTYSNVYCGLWNQEKVAVKVIKAVSTTHAARRKINRERTIWAQLDHPNVLPFYGYVEGEILFGQFGALVSPWYPNGDAGDYLSQHGDSLTEQNRVNLWKGTVDGVSFLHLFNPVVIHGDLKPGNVLIDDHGNAKICDFGLVRVLLEEGNSGWTTTSEHTGTERYLAYELVAADDIAYPTTESDIWALACLGLEFVFLQIPYSNRKNNLQGRIIRDIEAGRPPAARPDYLNGKTHAIWEILETCWNLDPQKRPQVTQICDNINQVSPPGPDAVYNAAPNSDIQAEERKYETRVLELYHAIQSPQSSLQESDQPSLMHPQPHGPTSSQDYRESRQNTQVKQQDTSAWPISYQDRVSVGFPDQGEFTNVEVEDRIEHSQIQTSRSEADGQNEGYENLLSSSGELIPGSPEPSLDLASIDPNALPDHLRLDYENSPDIMLNSDGTVRAGTLIALVERLTTHLSNDVGFNDTFLTTFRTFATVEEVFDALVERYNIEPPASLTFKQVYEWKRIKKTSIRLRTINILRKLIDVLEEEDLGIIDRFERFAQSALINNPDMYDATRSLLYFVQRVGNRGQVGGKENMIYTTSNFPPLPRLPRIASGKKLKLLDIEPLELARQLSIMESEMFLKTKQSEWIARSMESTSSSENIKNLIAVTNKIADWVASEILSKPDTRKRVAVIKYFVHVAERCCDLNNFSSMAALVSGLRCGPIHRLKYTWEQVNVRFTTTLNDLEKTLDIANNFQNYKALLNQTQPPCVPFVGVYLTTLSFIHDNNKDTIESGGITLINFQKRQRINNVLQGILRFQSQRYSLHGVPMIRTLIEDSLARLDSSVDFWRLSLAVEPKERDDEKSARLLQESGFL